MCRTFIISIHTEEGIGPSIVDLSLGRSLSDGWTGMGVLDEQGLRGTRKGWRGLVRLRGKALGATFPDRHGEVNRSLVSVGQ